MEKVGKLKRKRGIRGENIFGDTASDTCPSEDEGEIEEAAARLGEARRKVIARTQRPLRIKEAKSRKIVQPETSVARFKQITTRTETFEERVRGFRYSNDAYDKVREPLYFLYFSTIKE
jgi:hypothetical protein